MPEADKAWHVERARAELDAAYRSDLSSAAAIHLRLCALHLAEARRLEAQRGADGDAELDWMERFAPLHERSLVPA